MLRLREIMSTEVLTVAPETSVRDAMELLAGHHVSGAPVVSGGKLVGVVTGSDLMTFAAMLPGVPTARPDESEEWGAWEAEESASAETAREVEAGNEPPGAFFSELWDDSGAPATERMSSVNGPEWNVLEEHDVSEVMTAAPLVTLSPDATAEEAAELMNEKHIHRVLVTEDGVLRGVVSALDIAKAAAERLLRTRTYVFNHDGDFRGRERA